MARKNRVTAFNGAYIGLNPSRFALANYHCETCGTAFSSNEGIIIMCPSCGSNAKKQNGRVIASSMDAFRLKVCPVCTSELYSDIEPSDVYDSKFYCPECGEKVTVAEEFEDLDNEEMEDTDDTEVEVVDEDSEWSDDDAISMDEEDTEDSEEIDEEIDNSENTEEVEVVDDDEIDNTEEDEDEEAESMVNEINKILDSPLPNRESLAMDLWHNEDDTIRNVVICGMPVARIHLSEQIEPSKLEEVFDDDTYVNALADSMLVKTVGEVLTESRARVFKGIRESNILPRDVEVESSVNEKLNSFRKRFKETFLAVIAGTNKNLFPDVINSLKNGLWEAMAAEGIEAPETIIEPVFDDNANDYVDQVFTKTIDLLEKSEEVRKEILQMVENSGTQAVTSYVDEKDQNFAKQLAQSSVPIKISKSYNDIRDNLRSRLRLGR